MPENDFLTFRRFNDEELATHLISILKDENVAVRVEDNETYFDPSFANNPLSREIRVKLKPADFTRADTILQQYYQAQLNEVESDYYLFDFSNDELRELIRTRDEWGVFDFLLAQKILNERGAEIKPEATVALQQQRLEELKQPEEASQRLLVIGFICSVLMWIVGMVIGWHLSFARKTLPNGETVYRYYEDTRDKGTVMLLISTFTPVAFYLLRQFLSK